MMMILLNIFPLQNFYKNEICCYLNSSIFYLIILKSSVTCPLLLNSDYFNIIMSFWETGCYTPPDVERTRHEFQDDNMPNFLLLLLCF